MASLSIALVWSSLVFVLPGQVADDKDQLLFGFDDAASVKDWTPVKLPAVKEDQPAPKVEIVPLPKGKDDTAPAGKGLKITFDGGDWPTIGTTRIPVQGNWKQFQTLKADLTVDRPSVAYFRVYQGKPDNKTQQARWEKTLMLLPGRNDVTLLIRQGIATMVP